MEFEDPRMQAYFDSLPPRTRAFLRQAKLEVSSPGELMMIGEHFRRQLDPEEPAQP